MLKAILAWQRINVVIGVVILCVAVVAAIVLGRA